MLMKVCKGYSKWQKKGFNLSSNHPKPSSYKKTHLLKIEKKKKTWNFGLKSITFKKVYKIKLYTKAYLKTAF